MILFEILGAIGIQLFIFAFASLIFSIEYIFNIMFLSNVLDFFIFRNNDLIFKICILRFQIIFIFSLQIYWLFWILLIINLYYFGIKNILFYTGIFLLFFSILPNYVDQLEIVLIDAIIVLIWAITQTIKLDFSKNN